MHGAFETTAENKGKPFRTYPLASVYAEDPLLIGKLAEASASVQFHFLEPRGWEFRVHPGSLTFKNRHNHHRSVKAALFVRANQPGLKVKPSGISRHLERGPTAGVIRKLEKPAGPFVDVKPILPISPTVADIRRLDPPG